MAKRDYDFGGYATKNNLRCSDGRVILKDAFKHNDGCRVPLVWGHIHNDPDRILGHADLENREDGVYAYCKFNDTKNGQTSKMLVEHGDIVGLSICANHLKESLSNVMHGDIKEVSLVLSGANPGAFIDNVISHGEELEDEAIIFTGEELDLNHSDEDEEIQEGEEEMLTHADDSKEKEKESIAEPKGKTVKEVLDTLNKEQEEVVSALIGQVLEDAGVEVDEDGNVIKKSKKDEEDDETMKHNAFEKDVNQTGVLTHADQLDIINMAKSAPIGTFQTALKVYAEDHELEHADAVASGFVQPSSEGNVSMLFPEYKEVRPGAPELLTNDQGWITTVLNKVHKSPISRIRTSQVDIRNIEKKYDGLRAHGYQKGKEKKQTETFTLIRRTTDPQTIYVKSALHRDDIIDITDFDYVQYLYNIDRMQLNEELATAIMLGDGRGLGEEDKIDETHIRPIWLDDDLYTIHVDMDVDATKSQLQGSGTGASFGENYILAETMVNTVLYAREKYKGSGTPDMYITPHMLNVMLLARDMNGRRIYSSVSELASSLNVGNIYTAEQFEGRERTDKGSKKHKLQAIICNLADYSLGATRGGEITHFTQFDIDFNQQKSLLETRCSGALTRVYSAIAIETAVEGE